MTPYRWITTLLLTAAWQAGAQTSVDLTRQGKLGSGTLLPAACTTGQMFLKTDTSSLATLYVCRTPNMWTGMGTPSAGDGVAVSGNTVAVEDAVIPNYYTGSGAPTIGCAAGRDFYIDTTAGVLYFCMASGEWQQAANSVHTHAASDITSGTLNASLMPASVVQTGQANNYAAGQRQSVLHNSTNAGLRLVPGSGDPANAQDGDLWYNLTTNKFRFREGGVVADFDRSTTFASEMVLPLAGCMGPALPALKWDTPPTGVAAAIAAGCDGSNIGQGYGAFPNAGTPAIEYSDWILPQGLTGTADVSVAYWTATANGTFNLALDLTCTPLDGSAGNDPAWTAGNFFSPGVQTAPAVSGAPSTVVVTGLAWPAGCLAGAEGHLRLIRNDTDGTASVVNVKAVRIVLRRIL